MRKHPPFFIIPAIAAGLGMAGLPTACAEAPQQDSPLVEAEIASVGMDHLTQGPVVLVRESAGGKFLPIWVGPFEAQSIFMALRGIETPRPMTHDLAVSLLAAADAKIEEVVIYDLRDNTYYAIIQGVKGADEESFVVDSRPSDAMALALRSGARILVNPALIENIPQFDFEMGEAPAQILRLLNITVVALDDAARDRLGLPPESRGLLVLETEEGAVRDIQQGDLILEVDGNPAATPSDLLDSLEERAPEQPLRFKILREGSSLEIEVPLLPVTDADTAI